MYILKVGSLIFVLGLLVSKLFGNPIMPVQQSWDDEDTRTYNIHPFTKIFLEGTFKVILEQGSQSGLRIKTDEDIFKYVDVQSDAASLTLKITKKHFDFEKLILYITFKNLEELKIEGGISLETKGYVELKNFYLNVQGGADIEMNLKAENVKVIGEGGVKMEFDGIASELDATVSGAGYLDAIDLKARKVDIKIEGVGAASVYATENLYASISGIGKIRYNGEPVVFKNIEGIGLVSKD